MPTTLEQYLGIPDPNARLGEGEMPPDPADPMAPEVDRSGATPAVSTGAPTASTMGESGIPEGGNADYYHQFRNASDATQDRVTGFGVPPVVAATPEAPVTTPTVETPQKTQGPAPTTQGPTPTPPSTDYSQLNTLLAQLMAGQQADAGNRAGFRNNMRDTVMSLIRSGSAPVDANDPTITSATQAFRGEGERALALLREKQAEASRAGGRTAGSEESAMKGGYEDLGNSVGSYRANLQIQELQARRQQLAQAASLGAGLSNADESNALQQQIAAIDAQIKQLGLTQTDKGLTQQNAQFYDTLSSHMGDQTNTLDELLSQYLLNAA